MASSGRNEMDFHAFKKGSHVTVATDGSDCMQKDAVLTLFKLKVAELLELIKNIPAEDRLAAWKYWQEVKKYITTCFGEIIELCQSESQKESDEAVQGRDNDHSVQIQMGDETQATCTSSPNGQTESLNELETLKDHSRDIKSSEDKRSPLVGKRKSLKKCKQKLNTEWDAELVEATKNITDTSEAEDKDTVEIRYIEDPEMRAEKSTGGNLLKMLPENVAASSSKIRPGKVSDTDKVVHVQVEKIDSDDHNLTFPRSPHADDEHVLILENNSETGIPPAEQFQLKQLRGKLRKLGRKRKTDSRNKQDREKGRSKRRIFSELCIPVRKDDGTIVFQCDICGIQMALYQNLEVHLRTHTGQRPFRCVVCGKSFTTKGNLKEHEAIHDKNRPQFECDACGKLFKQLKCLKIHARTHTGERPHKCNICEKSFTQSGVLQSHLLTHTEEKNHLCVTCGKSFRLKSHLDLHIKRHEDKRDFKCEECGFETLTKNDLARHMVKHTGEKRYVCSQCPKRFTRAHYLKEHLNIHTGRTPFSCSECDASFSIATKLQCHKRKHRRELAEKLIRETQSENIVTQSIPQLKEEQSVSHIEIQTAKQAGFPKQTEKTTKLIKDSENHSTSEEMMKQTPLMIHYNENGVKIDQTDSGNQGTVAFPLKQTSNSVSEGIENFWAGDEQYMELVIGEDISVEDFNTLISSKVISVSKSEEIVVESPGASVSVHE